MLLRLGLGEVKTIPFTAVGCCGADAAVTLTVFEALYICGWFYVYGYCVMCSRVCCVCSMNIVCVVGNVMCHMFMVCAIMCLGG